MVGYTPRNASEAYVCDIRTEPGPDNGSEEIKISLVGTTGPLRAVRELAHAAARKAGLAMTGDVEELPPHQRNFHITSLTLSVKRDRGDITPESVLALVHQATQCDLKSSISAGFDTYDIRSRGGEINTRFIPNATITVEQEGDFTRAVVAGYLKNRLNAIYTGQYQYGQVGDIGIPLEFEDSVGLREGSADNKKIWLTYRDKDTHKGHIAKLNANAVTEHLSGVLGIPEKKSWVYESTGKKGTSRF